MTARLVRALYDKCAWRLRVRPYAADDVQPGSFLRSPERYEGDDSSSPCRAAEPDPDRAGRAGHEHGDPQARLEQAGSPQGRGHSIRSRPAAGHDRGGDGAEHRGRGYQAAAVVVP